MKEYTHTHTHTHTGNLKNKGITLIALVITIIILLILAIVTINVLTGHNGILTKTDYAKKEIVIAEEKEQIQLAYNTVLVKKDYETDIEIHELEEELKKLNNDVIVNKDNLISIIFNKTKNVYTINSNGEIIGPISKEDTVEALIPEMTANISDVGMCYYKSGEEPSAPAYYSFDGKTSTRSMSNLTYQTEDYLEYDFYGIVKIKQIELNFAFAEHVFSNCKVTASLDGINWDTIYESNEFSIDKINYIFNISENYNNKTYQFIRIWQLGTRLGSGDNRMCVGNVQINGIKVQNFKKLISEATSNNSEAGTCYYKSGEEPSAPAYYSFDGKTSTRSMSNLTYQTEDYLEYDFKEAVIPKQIILYFYQSDFVFSDSKITASLDNENWDTIIEKDDFVYNKLNYILTIPNQYNTKQYKYFRIWQLGNRKGGGDNRMGMGEVQILGLY